MANAPSRSHVQVGASLISRGIDRHASSNAAVTLDSEIDSRMAWANTGGIADAPMIAEAQAFARDKSRGVRDVGAPPRRCCQPPALDAGSSRRPARPWYPQ